MYVDTRLCTESNGVCLSGIYVGSQWPSLSIEGSMAPRKTARSLAVIVGPNLTPGIAELSCGKFHSFPLGLPSLSLFLRSFLKLGGAIIVNSSSSAEVTSDYTAWSI